MFRKQKKKAGNENQPDKIFPTTIFLLMYSDDLKIIEHEAPTYFLY